jgi:hypothetical protein
MTCHYCGITLTDYIVKHGDHLACETCEACAEPESGT